MPGAEPQLPALQGALLPGRHEGERAEAARIKLKNLYRDIYQIVKADLPEIFANDTHQINTAVECCYFHRGYIMQQALRMDYLLPACKVSKTIGAHLYV